MDLLPNGAFLLNISYIRYYLNQKQNHIAGHSFLINYNAFKIFHESSSLIKDLLSHESVFRIVVMFHRKVKCEIIGFPVGATIMLSHTGSIINISLNKHEAKQSLDEVCFTSPSKTTYIQQQRFVVSVLTFLPFL